MADNDDPKKPKDDEVRFELRLAARLTPSKARSAPPVDPERAARRHVQETGRRLMEPFVEEMVYSMIHDHRTCNDMAHRFKIQKYILDQVLGSPKPLTEEEKKGADAGTILDALAAMSSQQSAIEREGRETPQIEHVPIKDVKSDIGSILDQFADTVDGEIIP